MLFQFELFSYEHNVQYFRNPEYSKRPTFDDLFEILNGCDDDLLDWSKEDKDTQKASVIGSPVEDGKYLYQDLQSTYNGVTPDN